MVSHMQEKIHVPVKTSKTCAQEDYTCHRIVRERRTALNRPFSPQTQSHSRPTTCSPARKLHAQRRRSGRARNSRSSQSIRGNESVCGGRHGQSGSERGLHGMSLSWRCLQRLSGCARCEREKRQSSRWESRVCLLCVEYRDPMFNSCILGGPQV